MLGTIFLKLDNSKQNKTVDCSIMWNTSFIYIIIQKLNTEYGSNVPSHFLLFLKKKNKSINTYDTAIPRTIWSTVEAQKMLQERSVWQ